MGGLPGRSLGHSLARIHATTADANANDQALGMVSQDLSKAFDSVAVPHALAFARHYGVPMVFLRLIDAFYGKLSRVFSMKGC